MERTTFAGDVLLEQIYAMVVRTEASNMSGLLTDCPQRDERQGWLNDLTDRLESAALAHEIGPLLSKVADDIADSQALDGSIPDTVPFRWGFRVGDPVCLAPVLIPRLVYRHWGDGRIIERGYPVARAWLRYLLSQTVDGVLHSTHYGDWSEPKFITEPGPRQSPREKLATTTSLASRGWARPYLVVLPVRWFRLPASTGGFCSSPPWPPSLVTPKGKHGP